MMQSMTGYGRAEVSNERLHLTIEARSVNHRYLDVSLRYPRLYTPLESRIKRIVSTHFARGRIEIKFVEQRHDDGHWDLSLDYALAQQYYQAVQVLQERLGLPGAISFNTILNLREVVRLEETSEDIEEDWELITQGLENALHALQQMRSQEGAFLYRDLQTRLQTVNRHITAIRQRVPHVVTLYRQRLEQRVQELFRKIEFLVQEMHREVNTIASKSNDADISQHVVEVKSEFERIREQIQNIE
jgi:uncharacterized protein (TIGR00255 family)